MMKAPLKVFACAAVALLFSFHVSNAATIIKLDLGGTGPDLSFTGGPAGTLATISDGDAGTTGDQDTAILYTSFLSSNPATTGSYTLSGATSAGAPTPLGGGVLTQNFVNGNFKLYDSANTLLLNVNLTNSLLVGGGNGAFFNITNGNVIGGLPTLISQLVGNSIGMSMTLTHINTTPGGPPGLTIGGGGFLNPFVGDATKEITAIQAPEPTAIVLAIGFAAVPMFLRRRG